MSMRMSMIGRMAASVANKTNLQHSQKQEQPMGDSVVTAFNDQLSKTTSIFGLKLYVILGISLGIAIVLLLFLISLCCISSKKRRRRKNKHHHHLQPCNIKSRPIPPPPQLPLSQFPLAKPATPVKEIQEVRSDPTQTNKPFVQILSIPMPESPPPPPPQQEMKVPNGRKVIQATTSSSLGSGDTRSTDYIVPVGAGMPEVSHLGWGHWYTLRELELATNGFTDENVIGEGGYGIVYKGVLTDGTEVAVKNLLNNKGQAEREFKVEVEAIGRVRHKNLVRLLGYCAEGSQRMLVYEYVDNGNLEQWIHGDVGAHSPLTWDIRMNILVGTAKGLMYLHEGLEPKVVHRDVKSSNILLDKQWNAKVSDFGLAKLLGSERSYVTTRVMGTFGYVAPEYASTGMLTERSDVYSFGILIMEIISGRSPVDYSRPHGEVNLVDWLKVMVGNRNSEGVVDPKLLEKPPSRALKRALLVALRCVDPDAQKRPKMGHVIHMLETEDFPYRDERRIGREPAGTFRDSPQNKINVRTVERQVTAEDDSSGEQTRLDEIRPSWRRHSPLAK